MIDFESVGPVYFYIDGKCIPIEGKLTTAYPEDDNKYLIFEGCITLDTDDFDTDDVS